MNFRGFVESQDDDRKIDHGMWEDCAIGDYIKYKRDPEGLGCAPIEFDQDDSLIMEILDGDADLYDCLNHDGRATWREGGLVRSSMEGGTVIATYGDLKKYFNGELIIKK